jgi:hypothetical protein
MIALCIMMVSLYCVSYYATTWYTLQTKAEVEKICALFLYAQQKARTAATDVTIFFHQQEQSYSCPPYTEKLPRHLVFGAPTGSKGPPSAPEKPITHPITFEKNRMICYPDGTLQAGALYLLDTKTNTGYAITVPVTHASHVKRYRSTQSGWTLIP